MIRYPTPLGPGDRIAVTSPSAGVAGAASDRIEFCVQWLRSEGYEDEAATICRHLHGLRLAGWFEHASAILVGRTDAPDHPQMTQEQAVLDALGRVGVPLVLDVEIGHVPPHLPLVNGAFATVTVDGDVHEVVQELH